MQNFTILNSKEKKSIIKDLKECYGIKDSSMDLDLIKSNDKLYMISKELGEFRDIRFNNVGLYFARILNTEIRLSIEGSQIIGKYATKNIISLNNDEIKRWVGGFDVDTIEMLNGFALIKYKDDFFGSGKVKDGRIINFIPKERRIYNLSYAEDNK